MSEVFENPNYHPPNPNLDSIEDIPEGSTGIPILDAANKLKQQIDDAEKRAEIAEQEAKIAKQNSSFDKMTGLNNRNAWIDQIEHFDYQRGDNATLIVCDINGLKEINDTKGHSAGDKLIKNMAGLLKTVFTRAHDNIYRTGGDEFIISIKDLKTPEEQQKFEEFLKDKFSSENQTKAGVKFSFGIAHFDPEIDKEGIDVTDRENDTVYQTTFDRADSRMYEMKRLSKFSNAR